MSYSTGPGGYGEQPQGQGPSGQGYSQQSGYGSSPAPSQGQSRPLSFFLNLGVIALGIISFFLGFAPFAKAKSEYSVGNSSDSVNFFQHGAGGVGVGVLLAAALVAAFAMLPKQEPHDSVVAALSVAGFISLLFLLIGLPKEASAGFGLIIVLITSFLEAALAIAVLLFASGILKPPQPRQANYGYYGQPGGQPGYGQPQQPYYGAPGSTPPSYQPPPPPSQPSQPQQQPQGQQSPQNPQNPW